MWTITITFLGTEQQAMLGFRSQEAATLLFNSMMAGGSSYKMLVDDFGQAIVPNYEKIAFTELAEVKPRWEFRNKLRVARLRAENDYQTDLQQDPTLKFLVGQEPLKYGG
jgi:hypothetical protein